MAQQATEATEADHTTTEHESTEAAIEATNSSKVADRLRELQEATDEAADSYSMTVEANEAYGKVTYNITIESSERFWNEGELGDANYRVTLGPRGGFRRGRHWSDIPNSRSKDYAEDFNTVRMGWRLLRESISSAR